MNILTADANKNVSEMLNRFILLLVLFAVCGNRNVFGQTTFRLNGYVKGMPSVATTGDFNQLYYDNLLHNRLNMRWQPGKGWQAVFELRNRVFIGDTPRLNPHFGEMIANDPGFMNLSRAWKLGHSSYMHVMSDRLYVQYRTEDWQIRLGRQRINWGINMVSNPNDLFNTYSFFDFDYEERPGADALRIERYLGGMSRIELAISPTSHIKDAVAAMLYAVNYQGYDVQLLAGYYKNRLAFGGGWAGSIGGTGFKGEATLFHDIEAVEDIPATNLVAAISLDHLFAGGLYVLVEGLYNGGNKRQPVDYLTFTEPLRPDNITFSEYSLTASAMMPFTPIFSANAAIMYFPDMGAVFAMPGFTWSAATNVDLSFVAQAFTGRDTTIFGQGGLACYVGLKWSF
jgi:hypothetical protein